MTGRDFIECALRFAQVPIEGELRSAVSRAYYGAFHDALHLLRGNGVRLPRTEQVHVKVGFCLRDCGDPVSAKAAQQLEVLRNHRKAADYDLDDTRFTDSQFAFSEIARAQRIMESFDRCRSTASFGTRVRSQAKLLGLPVMDE
jgi:uncharacterized protein (UPF0332 family)